MDSLKDSVGMPKDTMLAFFKLFLSVAVFDQKRKTENDEHAHVFKDTVGTPVGSRRPTPLGSIIDPWLFHTVGPNVLQRRYLHKYFKKTSALCEPGRPA